MPDTHFSKLMHLWNENADVLPLGSLLRSRCLGLSRNPLGEGGSVLHDAPKRWLQRKLAPWVLQKTLISSYFGLKINPFPEDVRSCKFVMLSGSTLFGLTSKATFTHEAGGLLSVCNTTTLPPQLHFLQPVRCSTYMKEKRLLAV